MSASLGDFNAVHIRRGDFKLTFGTTTLDRTPAEVIRVLDESFGRDETLLILTDEREDPFFDEITRLGGKPLMWKTGHSHIKNKMAEIGAPLAGEMSAHIFFKHRYYGYDDALYVAVRLLSAINRSGESLASLHDRLPAMVNTPELRFDCPEDRKFQVIDEVKRRIRETPGLVIHDIDGVRVETEDGWWLLRASNTQAVLVARCESETEDGLQRLKAELGAQLEASGLDLPESG